MITKIRRSADRGFANHGWLKSRHTFSFANYLDPEHMGFRSLRVINEDRIDGGSGFGAHPHRDMEIISYVLEGALEHQDSMGNRTVIKPGEVQRMSAGSGVVHSEYNQMANEKTHFFQIWIMPHTHGGNPGYGQKSFEAELNAQAKVLVVSGDGREGSIPIQQDADIYLSRQKQGDRLEIPVRRGRGIWLQVVRGQVTANQQSLETGDALSAEGEGILALQASADAELMIFDLA